MLVCQKITGELIRIAFSVCIRTNWSKLFFERHVFSLSLSDFPRNFFALIKVLLVEVVKTAFYVSLRTFSETILSCKHFLLNVFQNWVGILMKFLRRGCQNCIIRVQANNFRKSFGFWKKCNSLSFSDIDREAPAHFSSFFDAIVKTAFYVSRLTFWKKKDSYWNKILVFFFRYWTEFFQPFVRVLPTVLLEMHSTCLEKYFGRKI